MYHLYHNSTFQRPGIPLRRLAANHTLPGGKHQWRQRNEEAKNLWHGLSVRATDRHQSL